MHETWLASLARQRLQRRRVVRVGADGAQLFDTKQYGALICGLKLQELHPSLASKVEATAPLLVVEGPTEPSSLEHILRDLVEFFLAHDPGAPPSTHLICIFPISRYFAWVYMNMPSCRPGGECPIAGHVGLREGGVRVANSRRRRGRHAHSGEAMSMPRPCR